MNPFADYALLAPVPIMHLDSGQGVAAETGFVAFGSRKWELFRKIDADRGGSPVPVLIYPSHEDDPAKMSYIVSWVGWYVGSEETNTGAHSAGMKHRPETTAANATDNLGHWAVFWHITNLRELPPDQHLRISSLETVKGGWRKNAPPRGPELVAVPDTISFPENP